MPAGPGQQITLHFTLQLETGEVIDSTREKAPAIFAFGDGSLPQGFEQTVVGMEAGQQQVHRILPEQAFGMPNPNNIQQFPRKQFSDMALEVGLVLNFADASQSGLPGMVSDFNDEMVTIDFNHPLAGKTLLFDVEILALEPVLS